MARSRCPINATLEALGDRWSLLVVRDLLFKGKTTYSELLSSGEGIATNVLADRLRTLEAEGILDKAVDPDDARRIRYALTPKGLDLAPLMVEMIVWGARHHQTDAPPAEVRRMTRDRRRYLDGLRRRAAEERRPRRAR